MLRFLGRQVILMLCRRTGYQKGETSFTAPSSNTSSTNHPPAKQIHYTHIRDIHHTIECRAMRNSFRTLSIFSKIQKNSIPNQQYLHLQWAINNLSRDSLTHQHLLSPILLLLLLFTADFELA